MRTSAIEKFGAFITLGFALIVLWSGSCVEAQVVTAKREQETLGSVQVGDHTVSVKIAYQADSALLTVSFPGSDGGQRYIPLIGSTYRGISSFQLDVLSPVANDEIWIRMSKPRSEVLAYYRFGSDTALTQFGQIKLLETPFPEHLSGGPLPFPKERSDAQLRASFFHYDNM